RNAGQQRLSTLPCRHRRLHDRLQPRSHRAHVGRKRSRAGDAGHALGTSVHRAFVRRRAPDSSRQYEAPWMSRAFAYIARELAKSYALIGLALLVLFDLLAFITESKDIGDFHYGVLDALLVVAYRTPALLVDLSPFIALLGT